MLCVLLRILGRDPAEAVFESTYVASRSRSCPRCVWLRASWSGGTSRRRHAMLLDRSACLPSCCWWSSSPSRACAGSIKNVRRRVRSPLACREALLGRVAPPSCSLRAALSLPSLHRDCIKHPSRLRRFRCTLFPRSCSPGRRRLDTGLRVISRARHSELCKSNTVLSYSSCLPARIRCCWSAWPSRSYHCEIGALLLALTTEGHGFSDRALRGQLLSDCPEANLHRCWAWQQSSSNNSRLSSSQQLGRVMNCFFELLKTVVTVSAT